jgi:hypothetical protein
MPGDQHYDLIAVAQEVALLSLSDRLVVFPGVLYIREGL